MVLSLTIISLSTVLLSDQGFQFLGVKGNLGVAQPLAILMMISGIGIGIILPA
jgi:hypothetical protein